jgi:hypothetical protein
MPTLLPAPRIPFLARALCALTLSVLMVPAPARSQRTSVTVDGARPSAVTLAPGERPAVMLAGRPVSDVRASLVKAVSGSERAVEIAAGAGAPAGTYELVVTFLDATRRTQTLSTRVGVTVEKAAPPVGHAARGRQRLTGAGPTHRGRPHHPRYRIGTPRL